MLRNLSTYSSSTALHPAGPDSATVCRLSATIRATKGQSDPKTDRVAKFTVLCGALTSLIPLLHSLL